MSLSRDANSVNATVRRDSRATAEASATRTFATSFPGVTRVREAWETVIRAVRFWAIKQSVLLMLT